MNWEVIDQEQDNAKIKVVGVGGAGGNAVRHMIDNNIEGVEFICANTDTQALAELEEAVSLKLGNGLTKGLGAGANPEIGRRAAESDREAIEELLTGSDMVFITASPQRCASRWICVSTGKLGTPKDCAMTTLAVLCPTPGSRSSAAKSCGTSPQCSSINISLRRRIAFDFCGERPQGLMISRIVSALWHAISKGLSAS